MECTAQLLTTWNPSIEFAGIYEQAFSSWPRGDFRTVPLPPMVVAALREHRIAYGMIGAAENPRAQSICPLLKSGTSR
jgi:hypothetical protein